MLAAWVAAVETAGQEGRLQTSLAPGLQQLAASSDDEADEEAELAAAQADRIRRLQLQRQQLQQVLVQPAGVGSLC